MKNAQIEYLDSTASDQDLNAVLNRDGCVILTDVIDPAVIDTMQADLRPYMEKKPTCEGEFAGYRTKRLHSLFNKSEQVADFITHDTVLRMMDLALSPFCDNYQLSSNSITAIGPGETPQPLHRDDLVYPLAHPSERNACCTAFWALTDFTADNGATRLIPRSHQWDDQRKPTEQETVQAIMPKGSVCFFVGGVYHGGSPNVTQNEWRAGMYSGYCLGWLRQEQNFYLSVSSDKVVEMPEKLARLLGYSLHRPFLGWVQDFQDPWDVIQGYEELSNGDGDLYAPGASDPVQADTVKML